MKWAVQLGFVGRLYSFGVYYFRQRGHRQGIMAPGQAPLRFALGVIKTGANKEETGANKIGVPFSQVSSPMCLH